jgi:hypothetical protein
MSHPEPNVLAAGIRTTQKILDRPESDTDGALSVHDFVPSESQCRYE